MTSHIIIVNSHIIIETSHTSIVTSHTIIVSIHTLQSFMSQYLEISLLQSGQTQATPHCEGQMVDVYREKPIRLVVKVTVPVKEHPKVNTETLISLFLLTFRDGMMRSLRSKSTFCVKQKIISLHNLNIYVIRIFHLPIKTGGSQQHHHQN